MQYQLNIRLHGETVHRSEHASFDEASDALWVETRRRWSESHGGITCPDLTGDQRRQFIGDFYASAMDRNTGYSIEEVR